MRILGVDPGTQRTGAGVIEIKGSEYRLIHSETIHLSPTLKIAQKLVYIYRSLRQIIKEHQPDVLALEDVFYAKDIRATVKIGEARACAMLAASEEGLPVVEYLPTQVKKSLSGNGQATKEQIQFMIKSLLKLTKAPQADSADALAVAICHFHNSRHLSGVKTAGKRTWESVVAERQKK